MKQLLLWLWAVFSLSCKKFVIGTETNFELIIQHEPNILRMSSLWLIDLETSYEIGFSHQFKHLKYRKNLSVPNHNIPRGEERSCRNVSFCSIEQNRRLIDQFGYESVLNSTIHEMLHNPRARLFEFENHWGEFQDYHFSQTEQEMLENHRARIFEFQDHWVELENNHVTPSEREGICTHLIKLGRRVKSVYTFGTCIRLFEKWGCRGWSLAVYPGNSNLDKLEAPRHVTFQAIGPCLENEFSGGFLNKSTPGFVIKNPEMRNFQPDLAMMFNPDTNLGREKVFGEITVNYLLGPKNRTEIIKADPRFLSYFELHMTAKGEEKDSDKSLGNDYGDVLGHAIPIAIGGPANEAFNVFPANQFARNKWESMILRNSVNDTEIRMICLQFEYEDGNKIRPLFFYFRLLVKEDETDHENYYLSTQYGRIINGHETNLKREKPYIQTIPKFEYKGTAKINLSRVLKQNNGILNLMNTFSSNNLFFQNLNRVTDHPDINWRRCKNSILTNDINLKENVNRAFLLSAQTRGMVNNPMVRLFSGKNLTGDSEDYHIGQTRETVNGMKGCYITKEVENVKSAETFGTCIRLFENQYCQGLSLAIYGGSGNSYRTMDTHLDQVQSVGPCLADEFMGTTFSNDLKGQIVKNLTSISYFPDLVQFGGFTWETMLVFPRIDSHFIRYGLGPKNRIEYIRTQIEQVGPSEFPKNVKVEKSEFYKSLDKKEGDVPCFAIPLELNGPPDESFNIFPISQSKAEDWERIFPAFSDVNEYLDFRVELHFVYENDRTTRPQFVYYRFKFGTEGDVYYGRFLNL